MMRKNYFDALLGPGCPGSGNTTGAASNPRRYDVTPVAPVAPVKNGEAEKAGQVLHINYGAGYRHPDGTVGDGAPEPMPPPAADWPADLDALLRRVSTFYEWSAADRRDFVQWARRSPDGLADARAFLEAEAARLPVHGLTDRLRVVLDMLAADAALRVAWACADDGADPVTLTLAIRGAGCCELAIPRERFDALALPQLIARLTDSPRPDGL